MVPLSRVAAGVGAHGVVGDLGAVAFAHEHPPRAITLTVSRGYRVALVQQRERGGELVVALVDRERLCDQLGLDPAPHELALDAVDSPPLQLALVLREAPGVALVVDGAGGLQLGDRVVDRVRLDPLALKPRAQLGDGAVAAAQRAVGELDRALELFRRIGQAARSSRSGPGSTGESTGWSTAATGGSSSTPMPTAA